MRGHIPEKHNITLATVGTPFPSPWRDRHLQIIAIMQAELEHLKDRREEFACDSCMQYIRTTCSVFLEVA